jgi:hypothetical protein
MKNNCGYIEEGMAKPTRVDSPAFFSGGWGFLSKN